MVIVPKGESRALGLDLEHAGVGVAVVVDRGSGELGVLLEVCIVELVDLAHCRDVEGL